MKATFSQIGFWLSPKQLVNHLKIIDQEAEQERKQVPSDLLQKRAWIVIGVACICLLMVHYLKYSSTLDSFIFQL